MFTGIIEATAKVLEQSPQGLLLERPPLFDDLAIGSSVSVSGVCLTVIELPPGHMRFQVVPETWSKTTLRSLSTGDSVNLEHAMQMGDRLDGHLVQGHVEGTAVVENVKWKEENATMTFHLPLSISRFVTPKGSIAVDGVSLTVASIQANLCSIALIRHTLTNTTLGSLKAGDSVNIETDVLIRSRVHAH
jgi:riboflavin synthase